MAAVIIPSTCSRHGPQLSDCAKDFRAPIARPKISPTQFLKIAPGGTLTPSPDRRAIPLGCRRGRRCDGGLRASRAQDILGQEVYPRPRCRARPRPRCDRPPSAGDRSFSRSCSCAEEAEGRFRRLKRHLPTYRDRDPAQRHPLKSQPIKGALRTAVYPRFPSS